MQRDLLKLRGIYLDWPWPDTGMKKMTKKFVYKYSTGRSFEKNLDILLRASRLYATYTHDADDPEGTDLLETGLVNAFLAKYDPDFDMSKTLFTSNDGYIDPKQWLQ